MKHNEGNRSKIFILNEYKNIQAKINEHFSVGLIENNIYT